MSGTKPAYYWDTCLFLAWINNETTRKAGEMDGIAGMLERFKKREISLFTSVVTMVEISSAKLPVGSSSLIEDVMQKPNFSRVAVDLRVGKLARDLRNYYLDHQDRYEGKTLSVPDAMHVATAILYRASEFHTFDGKDQPRFNSLGLLPLSGDVAGHALKICKPPLPIQPSFPGFAGHNGNA